MSFTIESKTHVGVIRSNNEDAICYDINQQNNILMMLIADGMGGHNAGEIASAMLIDLINSQWQQLDLAKPPDWSIWIEQQLKTANQQILTHANKNPNQQGMGTTGVLMIIASSHCYIGWIGDSRAYLLRNEQLSQKSEDHTMLQELVNKGAISVEEAKKANIRNLLSQAIGVRESINVGLVNFAVSSGDTIMLSTDGLHDYLNETEIKQYLMAFASGKNIADDMISQAIAQKSRDNLTLGLVNITQ
jgi:protein phosphatase